MRSKKRILVTGANRGLGLECVRQWAARGDTVFAACRNPESATDLKAVVGDVHLLALDVADASQREAVLGTVQGLTDGLDGILHNAGIWRASPLGAVTAEEMRETFEVNTIAPVLLTQTLLPLLRGRAETPFVAIITSLIGSVASQDFLHKGGFAYSTSKAAANMVAKYLSLELKESGIATAALSPGWVQTDMGGAEAPLTPPESVAGMIQVLDQLTLEQSGQFWNYDGKPLPW